MRLRFSTVFHSNKLNAKLLGERDTYILMHDPPTHVYRKVSLGFRRSWRVLTVLEVFVYFSADRGTEPMGSESSLTIGSGVRESIRTL